VKEHYTESVTCLWVLFAHTSQILRNICILTFQQKKKRKIFLTWLTVDAGDFDVVVRWSSRSAAVEWYNITIPVEVCPIAFTHALIYRVGWHQGRPKSVAVLRVSPVAGAAHTDASTVGRGCLRAQKSENIKYFFMFYYPY